MKRRLAPSEQELEEARSGVASRGWQRSKSAHHKFAPVGIRGDAGFEPCENWGRQEPSAVASVLPRGDHAGQLLWTCSTCKITQADSHGNAEVLVRGPE